MAAFKVISFHVGAGLHVVRSTKLDSAVDSWASVIGVSIHRERPVVGLLRGPPLEYWGRGPGFLLEINIFVGKLGEINKLNAWPQLGMVEINTSSTKKVENNLIYIEINISSPF